MNRNLFYEIRQKRGVTIESLSELTGIPVGTLSKISSGLTKPSYQNMCLIAKALECSLDDFTDMIESDITEDERYVLNEYRKLSGHGKGLIKNFLNMETEILRLHSGDEGSGRILECFVPTVITGDGSFYESCTVDIIEIHKFNDPENGDFAVRIVSDTLCPVYFKNDILIMKYSFPANGETAVFMNNHRMYIRKFFRFEDKIKLVGLNDFSRDLELCDLNDFICVGTVVTLLRGNVSVITADKYKKIFASKK